MLYRIGKASLFIYLFHYFAIQLMKTTFFHDLLLLYSNWGWDLLLCIPVVTIAVSFSLIIKFIMEQEPWIMKYVFYKRL